MTRRKPIDLTQLRREDAQVDGLEEETALREASASRRARRVESLPPSQIYPDRFQPRPLLPSWIRQRFFAGEINCYDAAREWLAAAEQDPGVRERVNTLLSMGRTFESHGQIKPLTGAWGEVNGQRMFLIETGERRYWAACLVAVQDHTPAEPLLQVLAVSEPARERQVIENQHAEPPTAVARAREVAALLLEAAGLPPDPSFEDDYDYFRQALELRHRMATWERLEQIIGITRPHMTRLLKVLQLPTQLLETADRYQVPERILREVLDLPAEYRERVLVDVIQQGGTHEDVPNLETLEPHKKRGAGERQMDPGRKTARRLVGILKELAESSDPNAAGALASYLVAEIEDPNAQLRAITLLEELARQLRARIKRK